MLFIHTKMSTSCAQKVGALQYYVVDIDGWSIAIRMFMVYLLGAAYVKMALNNV